MKNKIIKIILVIILILFSFMLIMTTNYKVRSLSAMVVQHKTTEMVAGATASGIIGGRTYYYMYAEFNDKSKVKFEITESLYNKYSIGSKIDIEVKQLYSNIFNSVEEKRNPENYSYFIDNTKISYCYTIIDDIIIDKYI